MFKVNNKDPRTTPFAPSFLYELLVYWFLLVVLGFFSVATIELTSKIIDATTSQMEQLQFGPVDRRNLNVPSEMYLWSIFMTASWPLRFLFNNK